MNIFLKLKSWQLFFTLFGIIAFSQVLSFNTEMNGKLVNIFMLTLPTVLVAAILFGWVWSVSFACYKALPSELSSSPKLMQCGLLYSIFYLFLSGLYFYVPGKQLPNYIAVMHFLALGATVYSFGFTAKQLKKLELNKNVTFFSYLGSLFLIWFFPLGVWFIQPKVNKLLGQTNA